MRPLTLTTPEVRELLNKGSVVVRRDAKKPKPRTQDEFDDAMRWIMSHGTSGAIHRGPCDGIQWRINCPLGSPGEKRWGRETWCPGRGLAFVASRELFMAPAGAALAPGIIYRADGAKLPPCCPWRPSIHMPRWASRLTVEVVSVAVEKTDRWEWVVEVKR